MSYKKIFFCALNKKIIKKNKPKMFFIKKSQLFGAKTMKVIWNMVQLQWVGWKVIRFLLKIIIIDWINLLTNLNTYKKSLKIKFIKDLFYISSNILQILEYWIKI